MNDTREKKLKEILESSHQLHLFGHITEIGTRAIPARDLLYATVLEHLSIDIQYKDLKVARKNTSCCLILPTMFVYSIFQDFINSHRNASAFTA